jgi:hypothetical protein
LSLLYAVLDRSKQARLEHLTAALAVWQYAEDSVTCIFGDSTGNPLADEILSYLRKTPSGMTRSEIRDAVGKHLAANKIAQALGVLLEQHLANRVVRETGGRPVELWFSTARRAKL